MDAAGDVAQLDQRFLGMTMRGADEIERPCRIERDIRPVLELLLGLPERHGQRGELSLGAVVQVAFDPAQRGGRVVDHLGAGGFEFTQPLVAAGLPEQGADQQPVQRRPSRAPPKARSAARRGPPP